MIKIFDNFFDSIGFNVEILDQFNKIYILVSGGIDSTLLAYYINSYYPNKTYYLNNFSPYENSKTLNKFKKMPNFIQTKSKVKKDYKSILEEAFLNIPKARDLKLKGKYHKKIFPCCYHIKHKDFRKLKQFKEPDSCVVSGIKRGDGSQRFFWLLKMQQMDKYIHTHKTGHNYVYPFRNYMKRELPEEIINELKKYYPNVKHSGCIFCPILILFKIKKELIRYPKSLEFYNKVLKKYNKTDILI